MTVMMSVPLTKDPLRAQPAYNALSLLDVLRARDLYHLHLTERQGVIGTAIGRYLIRKEDSWPHDKEKHKGTGPKTLDNTQVRNYSWPCVIVFVEKWVSPQDFLKHGRPNTEFLPDRLQMPDGKVIPVCVIEAPQDLKAPELPVAPLLPKNFFGGGYPVHVDVQGEEHVASVGCLVTDGHKIFAVTNRHVSGEPGEDLYAVLEGQRISIGKTSTLRLGQKAFDEAYPGWPGTNVWLNLDIGLIDVEDKNRWTPQIYSIGVPGALADLSTQNITLDLVNCDVRAYGCASREMFGRIWALFYRYKSMGGFEYVTDVLIGPRPAEDVERGNNFQTQHGDSGTLWLLEPPKDEHGETVSGLPLRPIALQWGGYVFTDSGGRTRQPFALATFLSTVCRLLEVDFVRDWGFSLPQYWGTVGHFTIANMACEIVSAKNSNLRKLMQANLDNVTIDLSKITVAGTQGLSKQKFVPMADVPDLVWKMPSGTGSRGPRGHNPEAPNHFADMDQPPPDGTPTLLDLCKNPENVMPSVWIDYARKFPKKQGGSSDPAADMGLLPFCVWQLYDAMVDFVKSDQRDEFIVAAGTLAHYLGDACQPLHISYLHHGDPDNPVTKTIVHTRGKKSGQSEVVNISQGVHEDYEQTMFKGKQGEQMKSELQNALDKDDSKLKLVEGGRAAAVVTVQLMSDTFDAIHPMDICDAYDAALGAQTPKSEILAMLWERFGDRTIQVMADGCRHLAQLWESAWAEGVGDSKMKDLMAAVPSDLSDLYDRKDFLPSYLLPQIGAHLNGVPEVAAGAESGGSATPKKVKKVTKEKKHAVS